MTYTMVSKEYAAPSIELAAAAMLRDPEVWALVGDLTSSLRGAQKGYALEHWEWQHNKGRSGGILTAWFR